jgi:uncharacterized protein YbcC (UPF0753/DUF2309 family)
MTLLLDPPASVQAVDLEALVRDACLRIAPLWGLADMVAVNPYLGYAGHDLLATEDLLQRRLHAAVLPSWELLRGGWRSGAFAPSDLAAALASAEAPSGAPGAAAIAAWLDNPGHIAPASPRCLSIAASRTNCDGPDWGAAAVEDLGRFMAARCDAGVGRWALPDAGGLWRTWRTWMQHDLSMAMRGLPGVTAIIAALPDDAELARQALAQRLRLAPAAWADYLGRLLGELQGWAGWLRRQAWPAGQDSLGEMPELLTARLALDVAIGAALGQPQARPVVPPPIVPPELALDRAARLTAVIAWEGAWRQRLGGAFTPAAAATRAAAQAVFCIDVRSEGLRRALEAADGGIDTYGFAGFFAMPVAIDGGSRAQCPVLLNPAATIGLARKARPAGADLLASFRRSGGGGFAFMETFGLGRAVGILRGSLGLGYAAPAEDESAPLDLAALSDERRLALLAGMLANLGLARPYARLVLLCGHDSTVANNPQAAGLACGACGGHGGAVNARLAAALYNDPALRARVGDAAPPADSIAVAGLHDTATDEVRILDRATVPASHAGDLARLERALAAAAAANRAARSTGLPGMPAGSSALAAFLARTRHWAELRPEWGLAGNAAFIAAPRSMTRGADLGGRCFLHSYDAALDPDGSVLTLILTAPVVVASWINLQYWASTVDPQRLGSGSKALHSVVGGIGVAAGSGADLLPGLAAESVHDGSAPRHQPVRLQVYVAAATDRIDAVIAGAAHLRDLVEQGWIALHALDPANATSRRRQPTGGWSGPHS